MPEHNHPARSAPEDLVRHLAAWIRAQSLAAAVMLESARPPDGMPGTCWCSCADAANSTAALVRELKKLSVPVAGLDRMVLTEQPAVQRPAGPLRRAAVAAG